MKTSIMLVLLNFGMAANAATCEGVSQPSSDVSASFTERGQVESVLVKEGDKVAPGQLLAVLEHNSHKAELLRLEHEAAETVEVDKAASELEFRNKTKEAIRASFAKGASSEKELLDAEQACTEASFSLRKARSEKQMDEMKVKELKARLANYALRASAAAWVEKVAIEPGESPVPGEEHLRLVSLSPLWIESPVPSALARSLKPGDEALVSFPGQAKPLAAQVIVVSPLVDTASDTVRVRLSLANAEGKLRAGERVNLNFAAAPAR